MKNIQEIDTTLIALHLIQFEQEYRAYKKVEIVNEISLLITDQENKTFRTCINFTEEEVLNNLGMTYEQLDNIIETRNILSMYS